MLKIILSSIFELTCIFSLVALLFLSAILVTVINDFVITAVAIYFWAMISLLIGYINGLQENRRGRLRNRPKT